MPWSGEDRGLFAKCPFKWVHLGIWPKPGHGPLDRHLSKCAHLEYSLRSDLDHSKLQKECSKKVLPFFGSLSVKSTPGSEKDKRRSDPGIFLAMQLGSCHQDSCDLLCGAPGFIQQLGFHTTNFLPWIFLKHFNVSAIVISQYSIQLYSTTCEMH